VEPFETFEHCGCTVELYYDDDPMSPADWDTPGTLVVSRSLDWRPRGVEELDGTEEEARERRGGLLTRYLSLTFDGLVIPLWVSADSRGVTIHEDDDDPNAYIYTTHERITELCGEDGKYHTREWVQDALRSELSEWDAYVSGEVVGYVVKAGVYVPPEDGIDTYRADEHYRATLPVVDSCWGFYPDDGKQEPTEDASEDYRAAWEACDGWTRRYAYAVAEAFASARHEQEEREHAASAGIPTRTEG
jgi:hypothetical protein